MPMITKTNYPPGVAVFEAEDYTPEQLARKTRSLLFDFNFSAVVILPSKNAFNSETALLNTTLTKDLNRRPYQTYGLPASYADTRSLSESTIHQIERSCGTQFAFHAAFAHHLGPTSLSIRSKDGNNATPHIDNPITWEDLCETYPGVFNGQNTSQTASCLTSTMAAKGNGSDLIFAPREEFKRVPGKTNPTKEIWQWLRQGNENECPTLPENLWHTQSGAIVTMHSKEAGENTLPAPHNSPKRENDGNPQERITSVAFISGMG